MQNRFVLITGCSGGGKSTLLAELTTRGHRVVEEPGRRIVKAQLAADGTALPWKDEIAFARLAVEMAIADRQAVKARAGPTFFDRGLIDAASALQHLTGEACLDRLNALHPYHRRVFLAPPWLEIFENDPERRHGFEASLPEYERLSSELPALGYEVILLPKAPPAARADFVLDILARQ